MNLENLLFRKFVSRLVWIDCFVEFYERHGLDFSAFSSVETLELRELKMEHLLPLLQSCGETLRHLGKWLRVDENFSEILEAIQSNCKQLHSVKLWIIAGKLASTRKNDINRFCVRTGTNSFKRKLDIYPVKIWIRL